jgi:hypothetical protein
MYYAAAIRGVGGAALMCHAMSPSPSYEDVKSASRLWTAQLILVSIVSSTPFTVAIASSTVFCAMGSLICNNKTVAQLEPQEQVVQKKFKASKLQLFTHILLSNVCCLALGFTAISGVAAILGTGRLVCYVKLSIGLFSAIIGDRLHSDYIKKPVRDKIAECIDS